MNVFAVIALHQASVDRISSAVTSTCEADNVLRVGPMLWLVADRVTTEAMTAKLGASAEANPLTNVMILPVTNYNGRTVVSVWEWIKAKMEAPK